MSETILADRIVADPEVCGGRPRIQGTRVRVTDILASLASGETPDEIVDALPYVTHEDIRAALDYAARSLDTKVPFAA